MIKKDIINKTKKQDFIEIGKKVFCEKSYKETMIDDITKELGVAHGLFYHYYKSKREFLLDVIDDITNEFETKFNNEISKFDGKAINFFEFFMKNFSKQKSMKFEKLFCSLHGDKSLIQYIHKKRMDFIVPEITEIIEKGNKDGSWNCKHPKDAASFLLFGIHSFKNFDEDSKKKDIYKELILNLLDAGKKNEKK